MELEWFSATEYWLTRFVIERGLGVVYLLAFLALLGERGLLPVPEFLKVVSHRQAPSLFYVFGYSDRLARGFGWTGVALAGSIIVGLPQAGPLWLPMLVWFALWVLYLSIVNVGQRFYSFGWES